MKKQTKNGFTLIEVLLVIAIIAILAAIVIVAINPAKQFGDAQNAQRRSDVRTIIEAIYQFSLDNQGSLPSEELTVGVSCSLNGSKICRTAVSCNGINLDELTNDGVYLVQLPSDPVTGDEEFTGYKIFVNENGRVGVCAPDATGGVTIEVIM